MIPDVILMLSEKIREEFAEAQKLGLELQDVGGYWSGAERSLQLLLNHIRAVVATEARLRKSEREGGINDQGGARSGLPA